jgi:hypothetical protein
MHQYQLRQGVRQVLRPEREASDTYRYRPAIITIFVTLVSGGGGGPRANRLELSDMRIVPSMILRLNGCDLRS